MSKKRIKRIPISKKELLIQWKAREIKRLGKESEGKESALAD